MNLSLSSHIHAARCGDDLVLLDLAAGSYACLPGCGPLIEFDASRTAMTIHDGELAAGLLRIGALEEGPAVTRYVAAPAERDLGGLPPAPVSAAAVGAMLASLAWTARTYWRAPFERVLASARAGGRGACGDETRIAEAAAVFRRLLPWVPGQGECLYRSCYLLAFLRRHGLSASWVFGVQTYTFEAHCWLQAGDLVLDDHVEHVRGFAPILALEP